MERPQGHTNRRDGPVENVRAKEEWKFLELFWQMRQAFRIAFFCRKNGKSIDLKSAEWPFCSFPGLYPTYFTWKCWLKAQGDVGRCRVMAVVIAVISHTYCDAILSYLRSRWIIQRKSQRPLSSSVHLYARCWISQHTRYNPSNWKAMIFWN